MTTLKMTTTITSNSSYDCVVLSRAFPSVFAPGADCCDIGHEVACARGHVVRLDLSSYGLDGPIPSLLGRLYHLQHLDLRYNIFTGPIPDSMSSLIHLQTLKLSCNQLDGAIPPSLGNLHDLRILDLGHNNFIGSIPSSIKSLALLEQLNIQFNRAEDHNIVLFDTKTSEIVRVPNFHTVSIPRFSDYTRDGVFTRTKVISHNGYSVTFEKGFRFSPN